MDISLSPSRRSRLYILVAMLIVQFSISVTLLLIASTTRERLPAWGGVVDVALVFTLMATGLMLNNSVKTRGNPYSQKTP